MAINVVFSSFSLSDTPFIYFIVTSRLVFFVNPSNDLSADLAKDLVGRG
jgi:hypothetical protein